MSKCLWRNGSGIEELKKEPFPSPAILWIVNVRERKPREKKKVVNILGLWISQGYRRIWMTYFMIDVWQHSEYALDSEYAKVLNMLG